MSSVQYVNASGIEEIREFLADNHQLGRDHFTSKMLAAWAATAEASLADGNPPIVEIPEWYSVRGYSVCMTVSPAGLDCIPATITN